MCTHSSYEIRPHARIHRGPAIDFEPSPDLMNQMDENELLEAARGGDEAAFERLIGPYRGELQAHCYRMLGSLHDAEDALQDALLRAWRGLARFEGRSSLRSWLYRIATNSSLRLIERRPARVLPVDHGPPADPHDALGTPLVESTWIEPYPDDRLEAEAGPPSPEARYEVRESVELAFTAALQHLPPLQRAVLILSDVLGFAPGEVAETLEASPASVYSALQRARKAADERLPDQSQQQTLRALGDDGLRAAVGRFVDAWEGHDIDAIRSMLTEDAVLAMPPWATWFRGRDAVADFLGRGPLIPERRWKLVPTQANGQVALASYWADESRPLSAEGIQVLSFTEDGRLSEINAFRDSRLFANFGLPMDLEGSPDL
jgi:RNA polymerase sigma-70 factor, ECF subfamily